MALRFYNTISRQVEEFQPLDKDLVRMYTCGPTVYNFAHIGNFRAYIFEDLLRRVIKYCGFQIKQVMNLTDVDDKTIRDSQAAGKKLNDFTAVYKQAFFEDLKVLNIEPAEVYPAATDHIGEMIKLIRKLMEKGNAYQAADGCVYYSIDSFPEYGKLAKIQREQMRAGARVSHDEYEKESVADFALWKAWSEKDGDVAWDSPWGKGRPGWHIECSAMSMKHLGDSFDIHTGGVDNMFPHHEDEIAQSEAASGKTYARYWLHCAHLIVDGEKMSKSKGNFYTLRQVLEQEYSGRELRWVLLGTHYRQRLNFSFNACRDARASFRRIDDFILRLREVSGDSSAESIKIVQETVAEATKKFREGLEDDLNISAALAALFDMIREVNRILDQASVGSIAAGLVLDCLRDFDRVLGCLEVDKEEELPAEIAAILEERQQARKNKDFARSDELRARLTELGWAIDDTPKGPRARRI